MKRAAQLGYSKLHSDVYYGKSNREKKAQTIVSILNDYLGVKLQTAKILDVGASTGYVDNFLADYCEYVEGIDIDISAIEHANDNFSKRNLKFKVGNAQNLDYQDESFDIVICNHVYEHVVNDLTLINEIFRVLKGGGICFFTAGNRISLIEPHYKLPFLSILPRFFAHAYMRVMKKGDYYHEKHRTYWGLRRLVSKFIYTDYTHKLVIHPERFQVEYMIKPGSIKQIVAKIICKYFFWLCPTYIWILKKR